MSRFVQLPPADYSRSAFAAFSPQRAGFDLDDARAMMWMAQLAYETDAPNTIAEIAPLWGFKPVQVVQAQGPVIDTRALIGERPDCTVVAFAGTDPALARNLITDVRVRLTDENTHAGFQDAFDAAWPQIQPKIQVSARPLFFTGHSLGAALAVLAAAKAHRCGITPAAVYTFGMPRAGGQDFAGTYNDILGERTFRLVHGGDIVPCIPEWAARLAPPARIPFQHVGRMLKCESGGKFDRAAQPSPLDSNDPTFRAGVRENWINRKNAALAGILLAPAGPGLFGPFYTLLPFAIRDHLPDRYRHALEP
jgi:triacylglycerol lipase